ncbi:MAG: tetratricopeptide repeat protein [Pyrinomonadaceae bacterium]
MLSLTGRLAEVYSKRGRHEEAISELNEAIKLGIKSPDGWIGYLQAKSGQQKEAQKVIAQLKKLAVKDGGHYRYRIATIYAALAEPDQALVWLERSCDARDAGELALIKVDPMLEDLRLHPRFASLLRRMNLT